MTKQGVMDAIGSLAKCQGFYGRLYSALNNAEEEAREEFLDYYAGSCNDVIDLVLKLEC